MRKMKFVSHMWFFGWWLEFKIGESKSGKTKYVQVGFRKEKETENYGR